MSVNFSACASVTNRSQRGPRRLEIWLRGRDLNPRPLGYEPNELPDCSTPRQSQLELPRPRTSSRNPPADEIFQIKNGNLKSEMRWWAWVESNYRPHAYQACALTN